MKRYIAALITSIVLTGSIIAFAADTFTPNLNLIKPGRSSSNWDTKINSNSDKIDSSFGTLNTNVSNNDSDISSLQTDIQDMPEVHFFTGTFNSSTGTTHTLPKTVSSVNDYTVSVIPTTAGSAIADIYVTKTTTNFVVKNSAANITDTYQAVLYYEDNLNTYGTSIYRRYIVTPTSGDHADNTFANGIADVSVDQIGTSTAGTIVLPGNFTYDIKKTGLTIPFEHSLVFDNNAVLDTDFGIVESGTYQWTLSASGTSEYYLEANGGGDPSINQPDKVFENDIFVVSIANAGGLNAREWSWDDNDTLGYNTVYIRLLDSTDPDSKADDWVEAAYDVTIDGSVQAGSYKILQGNGEVTFSIVPEVNAAWYGLDEGANDAAGYLANAFALKKAMESLHYGQTLRIGPGTYLTDEVVVVDMNPGVIIKGSGSSVLGGGTVEGTILKYAGTKDNDFITFVSTKNLSGKHTGSNNAAVLEDLKPGEPAEYVTDSLVGATIVNTTDSSSTGVITANTATTITATLVGGENDWDTGDSYTITSGEAIDNWSFQDMFIHGDRSESTDTTGARNLFVFDPGDTSANYMHFENVCWHKARSNGILFKRANTGSSTGINCDWIKCRFWRNGDNSAGQIAAGLAYKGAGVFSDGKCGAWTFLHTMINRNGYGVRVVHDPSIGTSESFMFFGTSFIGNYTNDVLIDQSRNVGFYGCDFATSSNEADERTEQVVLGRSLPLGFHSNAASSTTVMTDVGARFTTNYLKHMTITNTTDSTNLPILSNTETTITHATGTITWDLGDRYELSVSGTDDTSSSHTTTMTDTTAAFTADALIGMLLTNTTDNTTGFIVDNTATTIVTDVSDGFDWDSGEGYTVTDDHFVWSASFYDCYADGAKPQDFDLVFFLQAENLYALNIIGGSYVNYVPQPKYSGLFTSQPFDGVNLNRGIMMGVDLDVITFAHSPEWILVEAGKSGHIADSMHFGSNMKFYNVTRYYDNAYIIFRDDADTYDTFKIGNDGTVEWGAGGGSALDTNLYRSAASVLETDDKFLSLNLGCTSVATTTAVPANPVRRWEFFDRDGNSQGWVPVYDIW